MGTCPSAKKVKALCDEIREMTARCWTWKEPGAMAVALNQKLRGWKNYFCLGAASKAYRAIDAHVAHRLRQWLCAKHQVPGQGKTRYSDKYLYETLNVIRLSKLRRDFS